MNLLKKIDWAVDTIRDQLMFGRDALGAAKSRELRAKGVLLDCKEDFTSLQSELNTIIKYYKDTYKDTEWDMCCNGFECGCMGKPIDPEYYIYESLMKVDRILNGELDEKRL